jgi:hypothetical protein
MAHRHNPTVTDADLLIFTNQSAFFDEGYWHNAFTRIRICHRIGANDLAILRHDAGLLTIQVEHLAMELVLSTSCGQSREPLP